MTFNLRAAAGLMRSVIIYYGQPRRNRAQSAFYRALLRPGALAFDVGAHIGTRARVLDAAGARVVAVEPQALFARTLRLTLPRRIALETVALGPAEGQGELAVSQRHPTVSSLAPDFSAEAAQIPGFEHVRWDRRQRVEVSTLDTLISRHGCPDYIKIDVEGFEYDVLCGLSRPVNLISVEYLPGMSGRTLKVLDRLAKLGRYEFNPVAGEDAAFLWQDWRGADAVADWVQSLPPGSLSGDLYARRVPEQD